MQAAAFSEPVRPVPGDAMFGKLRGGRNSTAASARPSKQPHAAPINSRGRANRIRMRTAASAAVDAKTANVAAGAPPRTDIPSAAASAASHAGRNSWRSLKTAARRAASTPPPIIVPMCSAREAKYPPVET